MKILENKCNVQFIPSLEYPLETTLYDPSLKDSVTLALVYKINTDNSTTLIQKVAVPNINEDGSYNPTDFTIENISDGWYKIYVYTIPVKDALVELGMINGFDEDEYQREQAHINKGNLIKHDTNFICAASLSGFEYLKRTSNPSPYRTSGIYDWKCLTIDELINQLANREESNGYVYGTNIKVEITDYFSYCKLLNCLMSKVENIISLYSASCSSNKCGATDNLTDPIRDYLWMSINAIKYAIELKDYSKANQLLNCVSSCSGICNDKTTKTTNCGCS